jgi:hypothetical protein
VQECNLHRHFVNRCPENVLVAETRSVYRRSRRPRLQNFPRCFLLQTRYLDPHELDRDEDSCAFEQTLATILQWGDCCLLMTNPTHNASKSGARDSVCSLQF